MWLTTLGITGIGALNEVAPVSALCHLLSTTLLISVVSHLGSSLFWALRIVTVSSPSKGMWSRPEINPVTRGLA